MEQIFNQLIQNFDFTLMLMINVLSYGLIKIADELNGAKPVPLWGKRGIFLASAIVCSAANVLIAKIPLIIAINSSIIAPIAWSWIFRPIMMKMGFGYKQEEK